MLEKNLDYFSKFDSIVVYYDNGQKIVQEALSNVFDGYNYKFVSKFNKQEEVLFQVADFLTYIDKCYYEYKHKIKATNTQLKFLPINKLRNMLKVLLSKRL